MRNQKGCFKKYRGLLVATLMLVMYLQQVSAQGPTTQIDIEKLNKALTTIDLFELNRSEAILKQLLQQSSSPSHYLYNFYLGKIYLRTALYYESKSKEKGALLKTSEDLISQAQNQFKKVVRGNGAFSDGYVYLALAYAQKIKYVGYPTLLRYVKRAEENIGKALERDPANPRAYLVQGIQMMYKPVSHGGGVDKAIPLLYKSVEIDPAFHEGYYWLARAYVQNSFKGRNEEKAKRYLSKALQLLPDDYFYQQGMTPDVQIPAYKEVKRDSAKK